MSSCSAAQGEQQIKYLSSPAVEEEEEEEEKSEDEHYDSEFIDALLIDEGAALPQPETGGKASEKEEAEAANEGHSQGAPSASSSNIIITYQRNDAPKEYRIVDRTDLVEELDQLAEELNEVMGLGKAKCKVLMRQFKCDKMAILDRFCESANPDQWPAPAAAIHCDCAAGLCSICSEQRSPLVGLACAHLFCRQCWADYLAQQILGEGGTVILCGFNNCTAEIDEDFALPLLQAKGDHLVRLYQRLQLNSLVENNPLIKWCPAPLCTKAVKVDLQKQMKVECTCGHVFCSHCLEMWHAPISCHLLHIWLKLCKENSGISDSLNDPCRPPLDIADNEDGQSTERKLKFLDYHDYYRRQRESMALAKALSNQIREELVPYDHYLLPSKKMEFMFMVNALDAFCEFRRTLMYSFAFDFFMAQDSLHMSFENVKNDLELATDQLNVCLDELMVMEAGGESENLKMNKEIIMGIIHYADGKRVELIQHSAEGTEHGQ